MNLSTEATLKEVAAQLPKAIAHTFQPPGMDSPPEILIELPGRGKYRVNIQLTAEPNESEELSLERLSAEEHLAALLECSICFIKQIKDAPYGK